ncbi:hypothetical protein N7U66_15755 [Lacinutrix neustonica]|uniref:Lipoprotein n=1 Tax=Lacinutrix neustonica TaxID=2980107 RepID=A0A9E8SG78_9FLAO|nr:hypothetical protein [Lacinutrix neustonica]WAC01460.1 hypothetical protein N7U66_15755 [Lacinutrix neustonica]
MKQQSSKILLLIVIIGFFSACNSVKRVAKNEHLLTKTSLTVNNENEDREAITNLIYRKPNSTLPLIGTPLRLHIYNLARPNIDSILKARAKKTQNVTNAGRNFYLKNNKTNITHRD